ncbi:uncharacterized protein LOC141856445 [Brevipalpus obovatus]|uniref:uncharacterized protein LOC141856445 n=1 Tax=Brevipalpus obovatus TaxID=246614 RepID=UPI003D9F589E
MMITESVDKQSEDQPKDPPGNPETHREKPRRGRPPMKSSIGRKLHNNSERKRKDKISHWINKIAEVLPPKFSKKESKNDILERAYCHIIHLREINDRILFGNIDKVRAEKFKELQKKVKRLEKISTTYYKLLRMSGMSSANLNYDAWKDKSTENLLNHKSDISYKAFEDLVDDGLSNASSDNDHLVMPGISSRAKNCQKLTAEVPNSVTDLKNNSPIFVVNQNLDQNAPKISLSNGSRIQIRPSPNVSVLGNGTLSIDNSGINQGPIILGSTMLAPPQQTLLMSNGQLLSVLNQPQPAFVYTPGSGFVLTSNPFNGQVTNLNLQSNQSFNGERGRKKVRTTTTIEAVHLDESNEKNKTKLTPKMRVKLGENTLLNLSEEDGDDTEDLSNELKAKHSNRSSTISKAKTPSKMRAKKDATISRTIIEKATDSDGPSNSQRSIEKSNDKTRGSNQGGGECSSSDKKEKASNHNELQESQVDYQMINQIVDYDFMNLCDFENPTNSPRYSSPLTRNAANNSVLQSDSNNIIADTNVCLENTQIGNQKEALSDNVMNSEMDKNLNSRLSENFSTIGSHDMMLHSHNISGNVGFVESNNPRQAQVEVNSYSGSQTTNSQNHMYESTSEQSDDQQKQKSSDQQRSRTSQSGSQVQKQKVRKDFDLGSFHQDNIVSRTRSTNNRESSDGSSTANPTSQDSLGQHNYLSYSTESLLRQPQQVNVSSSSSYQLHQPVGPTLDFNSSSMNRDSGTRSSTALSSFSADRLLHSSPVGNTISSDNLCKNTNQHQTLQLHSSTYRAPMSQGDQNESRTRSDEQQLVVQQHSQRIYSEKSPQQSHLHLPQHQGSQNSVSAQHWSEQPSTQASHTISQASSNSQRNHPQTNSQSQRSSHPSNLQDSRQSPAANSGNPRNIFNSNPYATIPSTNRERNNTPSESSYSASTNITNSSTTFMEANSGQSSFQAPLPASNNYVTPGRRPATNNPFGFTEPLNSGSSFSNSSENNHYNRVDGSTNVSSHLSSNYDLHRSMAASSLSSCDSTPNFLVNYPTSSLQPTNIATTAFSSAPSFTPLISTSAVGFENAPYLSSSRNTVYTPLPAISLSSQAVSNYGDSSTISTSSVARKQLDNTFSNDLSKTSRVSNLNKQVKTVVNKSSSKKVANKTRANDNRTSSSSTAYPSVDSFPVSGQETHRNHSVLTSSGAPSDRSERNTDSNDHSARQSQPSNSLPLIPSSRSGTSGPIGSVGPSPICYPNFPFLNLPSTDLGSYNDNIVSSFPPIKFTSSNPVLPHTNSGTHLGHSTGLQPNSGDNSMPVTQNHHQNIYTHRIGTSHPSPFGALMPPGAPHPSMLHDNRMNRMKSPRQHFA